MQTQLPLALGIQQAPRLDNFCWHGNQILFDSLMAFLEGHARQFHLSGEAFSGKSHLLQAISHELSKSRHVYYGSMKQLIHLSPDFIEHFEQYEVVVLDDIHLLYQSKAWQTAIFQLFNETYQKPDTLWISAGKADKQPDITGLKDLNSRLKLGLSLNINTELSPPETLKSIDWHIDFRKLTLNKTQKKLLEEQLPRKQNLIAYIFEEIENQSLTINHSQIKALVSSFTTC